MAKKKQGIDNTILVVDLVAELGNVAEEVLKGGSVLKKLAAAGKLLDEVIALKDLAKDELKLEFGDLDAEEREQLVELFGKKFDLQDDFAELLVERALDILAASIPLVNKVLAVVDIIKDGKKEEVKVVKEVLEKPVSEK